MLESRWPGNVEELWLGVLYTRRKYPRLWKIVLDCYQEKRVYSIKRIWDELLRGNQNDELAHWVNSKVPSSFFFEESIP